MADEFGDLADTEFHLLDLKAQRDEIPRIQGIRQRSAAEQRHTFDRSNQNLHDDT
jgi:hypothetical protein